MGTRGELVNGYQDLDAQASGRYSLAAGASGTVTATQACPVWIVENQSDSAVIYMAPARGFASADPAVNPAALAIQPGSAKVTHSAQTQILLFNPAGNPAVQVQIEAWR